MLIITTQSEELEIIFSSQGMSNAIDCCPYMGNLENIRTLIWRGLQLKFVPLRDNEDCCLCHSWARMVVSLFRPCHQLLLRSKNPSIRSYHKSNAAKSTCDTLSLLYLNSINFLMFSLPLIKYDDCGKVHGKYGTVDFLSYGFFWGKAWNYTDNEIHFTSSLLMSLGGT